MRLIGVGLVALNLNSTACKKVTLQPDANIYIAVSISNRKNMKICFGWRWKKQYIKATTIFYINIKDMISETISCSYAQSKSSGTKRSTIAETFELFFKLKHFV